MSRLDGLADVVVGWGEMRLRLQRQGGKDDAKAMSILAAKFWSFRIALKLRGITCTAQALPLRLKALGKMKLELELYAPASSSIYLVTPPSNPTSILSR